MAAYDGLMGDEVESGQDLYITQNDVCTETQGLALKRGSSDVYFVEPLQTDANVQVYATAYTRSTYTFTISNIGTTTLAAGTPIFVNGHGPFTVQTALANNAVAAVVDASANDIFLADVGAGTVNYPVYKVVSDTNSISASTHVLALSGRRYKIASKGAAGTTGAVANGKLTLGDVWTNGIVRVCSQCVTDVATAGTSITTDAKVTLAIGDQLLVGDYVAEDLAVTVTAAVTDSTTIATSPGCWLGTCVGAGTAIAATGLTSLTGANKKDLYKKMNPIGYTGAFCTEDAAGGTFEYVAQCSNRGYCDGSLGECKCFSGYTNDN
jgi:hypothetical protein